MKLPVDIVLTSEIEKVITFCPRLDTTGTDEIKNCKQFCPLSTICAEYWMGAGNGEDLRKS